MKNVNLVELGDVGIGATIMAIGLGYRLKELKVQVAGIQRCFCWMTGNLIGVILAYPSLIS